MIRELCVFNLGLSWSLIVWVSEFHPAVEHKNGMSVGWPGHDLEPRKVVNTSLMETTS